MDVVSVFKTLWKAAKDGGKVKKMNYGGKAKVKKMGSGWQTNDGFRRSMPWYG